MTEETDHKAEASQGIALDAEDHRLHALRLLKICTAIDDPEYDACIQEALIHSNLAIAEGQERVAEELAKLRKAADKQFTWWKRVSK